MDLDPGSRGGLELGLKIGPVKTSTLKIDTKFSWPHHFVAFLRQWPVSGHVVKRRELGRKTPARTRSLKGENSVGCVANDGNTIPPVLLFPRLRVPVDRLGRGARPGTLTLNSATGWMTGRDIRH